MENISIILGDITQSRVDAIVNAANTTLLGAWGGRGHPPGRRPGLLAECRTLGAAKPAMPSSPGPMTCPCRYVIHTPGPIWQGGDHGEAALLRSCYLSCLSWPWPTAAARWISLHQHRGIRLSPAPGSPCGPEGHDGLPPGPPPACTCG